jgi:hypothetical protein
MVLSFRKGGAVQANENAEAVLNKNLQIKHHTEEFQKIVKNDSHVPAWVVSKMTRAADSISDATHYLEGNMKTRKMYADGGMVKDMLNMSLAEILKNSPIKVENSPYHLDIELKYSKGGMNYFTSRSEERGFYLHVSPVKIDYSQSNPNVYTKTYAAFSGIKKLILVTKKYHDKFYREAEILAEQSIDMLVENVMNKIKQDYPDATLQPKIIAPIIEPNSPEEEFEEMENINAEQGNINDILAEIESLESILDIMNEEDLEYYELQIEILKDNIAEIQIDKIEDEVEMDAEINMVGKNAPNEDEKERFYIDFLNKKKGFKEDRIFFDTYEDAVAWGRENLHRLDEDMIGREMEKKVGEGLKNDVVGAKGHEEKIASLYQKSPFANFTDWDLQLLEMLQDESLEAYNIYQLLSDVEKNQVLQTLFDFDNEMGADGDGNLETTKENLKILLEGAKYGVIYRSGGRMERKYANGGGVDEFDISNLDDRERFVYSALKKRNPNFTQAQILGVHIANVEGNLSKMSPALQEYALKKMVGKGMNNVYYVYGDISIPDEDGDDEDGDDKEWIDVDEYILASNEDEAEAKIVAYYKKRYRVDEHEMEIDLRVELVEVEDKYANGGGVYSVLPFDVEVAFDTEGDYELEIQDFENQLKIIHSYIEFNSVYGDFDSYYTALKFYKNGNEIASLNGAYNENTEEYNCEFTVHGYSSNINFYPYGTMGGLDYQEFDLQIKNAVSESETYSAVVSIEGYEVEGQEFRNKEKAEIAIKELKENTHFNLIRGKRFGQGKIVEQQKVLKKYDKGGEIKKKAFLEGSGIHKNGLLHTYNGQKLARGGGVIVCPKGTQIQSLIFDKSEFNKTEAKFWAYKHNFKHEGIDEKANTYRIRQKDPKMFTEDGFRTIQLRQGVQATIGCPKKTIKKRGTN